VSLLLDALKEAEKSRKGLETAPEPIPATEKPVILDLELDHSEAPKVQTPATKQSAEETPVKELSVKKTENTYPATKSPRKTYTDDPIATPVTPKPVAPAPTPAIKPTQQQYSSLQNTRVATDVFQNRENANKKTKSRLPILLLILLLLLLGFLAMYFFAISDEESIPTRPQVNSQHELSLAVEPQADLTNVSAPTKTLAPNSAANKSAIENTVKSPNTAFSESTTLERQLINNTQKNLSSSNTQQTAVSATNKGKPTTPDAENNRPTSGFISSNNKPSPNPDFQITKRQLSNRNLSSLSAASEALKQGDLATAEQTYRKVLKQIPSNVAAMAGLATTLVQQGRLKEGQTMYYKVLDKDPENLLANIGLINLRAADASNLSAGSQLKQLLVTHPKQAYLHASLGNFYARRNKWPSAQGAYFEAFSLDTENPDYAFNLAISLDQMGKQDLASKYYEKALKLVEKSPSRFIKADVERRLNELKGNAP
jgi:Flp pilus assembly protein TadD/flagellar basal body-associated protein FliL